MAGKLNDNHNLIDEKIAQHIKEAQYHLSEMIRLKKANGEELFAKFDIKLNSVE